MQGREAAVPAGEGESGAPAETGRSQKRPGVPPRRQGADCALPGPPTEAPR